MPPALSTYLLATLVLTHACSFYVVVEAYSVLTIIDGENVRGKSNFNLRHEALIDAVGYWTVAQQHAASKTHRASHESVIKQRENRRNSQKSNHYVSLVIDHGAKPSAFYHPLAKRMADTGAIGTMQCVDADGSNNEDEQQHFTILFAGPNEKADDVIARDVGRIASAVATRAAASAEKTRNQQRISKLPQHDLAVDLDVIRVVTSDQGLRSRCRLAFDNAVMGNGIAEYGRKNKKKRRRKRNNCQKQSDAAVSLEFVPSVGYLSQLERELAKYGKARDSQHHHHQDVLDETIVKALHEDVELRGKLYQVECCLRDAKKSSRAVQRKALIEQGRKISEKIYNICNANGHTILGSVISSDDAEFDIDDVKIDAADVSCMLSAWDEFRRNTGRAELTGDRMVLAENMRRLLEGRLKDSSSPIDTPDHTSSAYNPSAFHYMCHKTFHNTKAARDDKSFTVNAFETATKALRLVIVSDDISRSSKPLPSGDVLFHLGNFTPDENLGARQRMQKLAQFNEWLSNQPHPIKIVLRGSRDPTADKLVLPFPRSVYVDIPRTISFGGGNFVLTLIPYCTSRILSSSWRRLPHTFDILVSHDIPILGGQDITGDSAERPSQTSQMIANKIENMFSGPPSIWLGGNTSEGFDKMKTRLASSSTSMLDTTIVCGKGSSAFDDGHPEGCMHPLVIDVEREAGDREMTFMVVTNHGHK